MIRLILCRLLICTWMIPVLYLVGLPFLYLCLGDFNREFKELNRFTKDLWFGSA